MCFSVQASFAVAAGTAAIGVLAISRAGNNKKLRSIAASPLFFAAQQVCEGLVWMTLNAGDTTSMLHMLGTIGFLFYASVFWPIWIPSTLYLLESNSGNKKVLRGFCMLGALIAALYCLSWIMCGTSAAIVDHHIVYQFLTDPFGCITWPYAKYIGLCMLVSYTLVTAGSFFVSSAVYMWLLGLTVSTAFIVTYIFYRLAFGSVWCFFAAVASMMIYCVVDAYSKKR